MRGGGGGGGVGEGEALPNKKMFTTGNLLNELQWNKFSIASSFQKALRPFKR